MSGIADHVPRRWLRLLVGLVIVALIVWIVDATSRVVIPFGRRVLDVIDPVVVAFALAYVLDPVVDWFESKGRSRAFAVWIVSLVALLLALCIAVFVVPVAVDQAVQLWP